MPILKWKGAEREALRDLQRWTRGTYTPLIEFIRVAPPRPPKKRADGSTPPQKPHDPERRALKKVDEALVALEKAHFKTYAFFLDPDLIGGTRLPDGQDCWTHIVQAARRMSLKAVPVVRLSTGSERLAAAVAAAGPDGMALRVVRDDLWPPKDDVARTLAEAGASPGDEGVAKRIESFRKRWKVAHLILDLGSLAGANPKSVESLMDSAYAAVSSPAEWSTLTIAGAAFPVRLTEIRKNGSGLIDRVEYIAWFNRRRARAYVRMPTFGDYAVQNSEAVDETDPTKPITPFAAIRYTLKRAWLVVKGEILGKDRGKQFVALAKQLAADDRFLKRPPHCEGCRKVLETVEDFEAVIDLPGWRRWGTVHHITLTVEQLGSLPAV